MHSARTTRKEMLTHLFQTSRKFTFLLIFACCKYLPKEMMALVIYGPKLTAIQKDY